MAEIIRFDSTRSKTERARKIISGTCEHKNVIAYTINRTVCCAACGIELDPFDVLVDILKAYIPDDDGEEVRLQKEIRLRAQTDFE